MLGAQWTTADESAAYVAHEVNQPLAAIVISAEIALEWLTRDPPNLDRAKQAIERVIGNSYRAADVARSARDQARKSPLVLADIDLNEVIECVLDLRALDLDQQGIALETDFACDLRWVSGDRLQLERLVSNLIANAIDAMSVVEDRACKLCITTAVNEGGEVVVTVQDSGVGLGAGDLSRIFDPFFTTKPHGMGLGLPICRSIVESHGGRLSATANPAHGCTFEFALPAQLR